ncbi:MAG TPA: hypothetical protein VEV45_09035 [Streptosporangiaceae bacterium]|nr:hypothetical protein [Streptosporangiaceae bacterium]
MQVDWILAGPVSAEAGSPTRSDADELRNRIQQLVAQHGGYVEVSKAGEPYPTLTLSISDDLAVVHYFRGADSCLLLQGDGLVPADHFRDFQVPDVLAPFTGNFISSSARAAGLIDAFARGADPDQLGIWSEL